MQVSESVNSQYLDRETCDYLVQELKKYADNVATGGSTVDLTDYYTKEQVDNKIPTVPTKTSELTNDSGFLTEHQSLEEYAKKTEIPDTSNFATKEEIPTVPTKVSELENDKGYLTEHQDLSNYATKEYVNTSIDNIDIPDTDLSNYYNKEEVDNLIANNSGGGGGSSSGSTIDTYSTEEQVIGTWIDGRTIYRQVLKVTLPEASSTTYRKIYKLIPVPCKIDLLGWTARILAYGGKYASRVITGSGYLSSWWGSYNSSSTNLGNELNKSMFEIYCTATPDTSGTISVQYGSKFANLPCEIILEYMKP